MNFAESLYRPPSYADLLSSVLRRYAGRTAFIDRDGEVTYRQLEYRIRGYAALLQARGMGKGDGVALLSRNRTDYFVAQAAAIILGCRYTPLHFLGSEDDHAFMLRDAGIRALVFDPGDFESHAERLLNSVPTVDLAFAFEASRLAEALPRADATERYDLRLPDTSPDELVNIAYTGGTTGRPKGVARTNRTLVTNTWLTLTAWQLPTTPRFIIVNPMSHGSGLMILPILIRGGTIILEPRFDIGRFVTAVERYKVNSTFLVPTMLYRVLDQLGDNLSELDTLETVLYGASPMEPERLTEAIHRMGHVFMQFYGQAEAPNTVAVMLKEEHDVEKPGRMASCGRAVVGIDVQLQDEGGREVSDGEVGEICVRGPLVMAGYWNQPDATDETLRGGWLHTGDLGVKDSDGFLTIVSRLKDMIITGGHNVFSREVEDALLACDGVADAAVIGVPDPDWGESIKAFVVLKPGATIDTSAILEHVRMRKGPIYVPKRVEIIPRIPLTAVGKPDKRQLRSAYWSDQDRGVH